MKTLHTLLLTLVTLATVQLASARADKSFVGEMLPTPTVAYVAASPDLAGKVVIVEFWATWCPPCRTSIPHLNELYEKYKEQGLVIIGITKEDKKTVTNFLKKTPMNYFPALDAGGSYSEQFGIKGIPHAIVADKTGKVVWEGHPMSLKAQLIEKLLK